MGKEGWKEFVDDCEREIRRHEERCGTDPDYCMDYVECYGKPFAIVIPSKPFDELDRKEIADLIDDLEITLLTANDHNLLVAMRYLLEHLKKMYGDRKATDGRVPAENRESTWDMEFEEAVMQLTYGQASFAS